MFAKLKKTISENENIICLSPVSLAVIKLYQKSIEESGFPKLPDDYWLLFNEFNGIFYNGAVVYGLSPKNNLIDDVLQKNLALDWNDEANAIVLGENENDLLLFDGYDEEFKIIDKTDEAVWKHSDKFEPVLKYLLGI